MTLCRNGLADINSQKAPACYTKVDDVSTAAEGEERNESTFV
ncbi:hypothetical protein [Haloarcula sediminis]|nr:hypothetical protein [Haloarcula sp. CK38]